MSLQRRRGGSSQGGDAMSHSGHCPYSHCSWQMPFPVAQQAQTAYKTYSERNTLPLTFPIGKLLLFDFSNYNSEFCPGRKSCLQLSILNTEWWESQPIYNSLLVWLCKISASWDGGTSLTQALAF